MTTDIAKKMEVLGLEVAKKINPGLIKSIPLEFLETMKTAGADMYQAVWFYEFDRRETDDQVRKNRYFHCFGWKNIEDPKIEKTYEAIRPLLPSAEQPQNYQKPSNYSQASA